MAEIEIQQAEGVRWGKITLHDETVVVERSALSHMRGDMRMKARLPGPIRLIRAALSREERFRPKITGSGTLYLESSLGGFHVLDLPGDETWIVEGGAFWASEGSVHQTFCRERIITSLKSGEGLLSFQTKVTGKGKVMLCSPGPVEEVILSKLMTNGGRLVADGRQVLARTSGIRYSMKFPGWMPWARTKTGESWLRTYVGEGRLLISTTPYWRYSIAQARGEMDEFVA